MISRLLAAGLLAVAFVCGMAPLGAATQQFVVKEQLNQRYSRELLQYAFTPPKGACRPGRLAMTGPDGPVSVQLSNIELWPKSGFVKAGKIAFVVDELQPLQTKTFTLTYDAKKPAKRIASDLAVVKTADGVEITTSRVGVRFPLGTVVYTPAKPAAEVPGPLRAMRLGAGAWAGGSHFTGDGAVTAWTAQLLDSGPVFARVRVDYKFADGNTAAFIATLAAGDCAVRWSMQVTADHPAQALAFTLPPVPGVTQATMPKGYGQWSRDRAQAITPSATPFCNLTPDLSIANAFPEHPQTVKLTGADGTTLLLRSFKPAAWVEADKPYTYAGFAKWELDNIPKMWEAWKRKSMPISYAADGTVTLQAPLAKGGRVWSMGADTPAVSERLGEIAQYVLAWSTGPKAPRHPYLFVDGAAIKDAWTRAETDADFKRVLTSGSPHFITPLMPVLLKPAEQRTQAERDRVVGALRAQLGLLGNFDVMRGAIGTAALYDALIDSDLLTAEERALFRAQMAYLGYLMADPSCWSMEHGANSGNPNMSVSYTLSLGIIACALPDHPQAARWAERATRWMDRWLTEEVGPNGEWACEGSHYGYVSLEPMISYAIAAKRAGYHDFSTDARFKKLLLYFARYHTPRDPQRQQQRGIGAYGRGHSGDRLACFGIAAPLFKDTDPALSRTLQWLWAENGYPYYLGDSRMGGFEPYYADRRLPMEAPKWNSELFPNLGALLRHGFNTPNESYLNIISHAQSLRNLDIWVPGIGGISQWFAYGQPLQTCFTFEIGYNERHELLRDGVRLARNYLGGNDGKAPFGHYTTTTPGAFAALPTADYVRATYDNIRVDDRGWFPPGLPAYPQVTPATGTALTWTRQLLYLKDADPAGVAYLVLRDTTRGGQPTAWQFWVLSEKIGSAEQVKDRAAFLADKPGQAIRPARDLPAGPRYTALGQFGVDVDFFIASPDATPRHTLRYGGTWAGNRVPEYQDVLLLQQPADGAYYVAVVPRKAAAAMPAFSKLADGAIIKVSGTFGTDYAFLAEEPRKAAADGVTFQGTAGAVQQRGAEVTLSLGAAGEVSAGSFGLAAATAASLRASAQALTLSLPADAPAGTVTLTAPAGWALAANQPGVKLTADGTRYLLAVPTGVTTVRLTR